MTTIAYHHKSRTIAWESRNTGDNGIIKSDNANKRKVVNGVVFWICGAVSDEHLMISAYLDGKVDLIPECNCFALDGGVMYRCGVTSEGFLWREPVENNDAIGSGYIFAMAGMDFYDNAVDAVKYAKKKDCYSGGRVHSMKIC